MNALERDGFKPTWFNPLSPASWFVRALVPRLIAERFATAPELLFVVSGKDVFARDLDRAADEPYKAGLRLDYDLLVAVSPQPQLQEHLERIPGRGQRVAWPYTSEGFEPLFQRLSRLLPRFDLYDETNPVRGRAVVGRKAAITDLQRRIERGGGVAVTGLRKVGKTTLVRAVTDRLDPLSASLERGPTDGRETADWVVSWVDLQSILELQIDDLTTALVEPLRKRALREGLSSSALPAAPLQRLQFLLRWWRTQGRHLCLVLDEFDLLFPEGLPLPRLEVLMRLFRGTQQSAEGLSVVLLGRDPTLMTTPELGGMTNPVLGWFSELRVGPLERAEANELLNKLGRRIGLEVGHRTRSLAYDWTGGHPLLHRQFGSAVLEVMRASDALSAQASSRTDPYREEGLANLKKRQLARDVPREVLDLLRQNYPDAYELFLDLSLEDDLEGVWAVHERSGQETLERFGLLNQAQEPPGLIRFFAWYTREIHAVKRARAV